MKATKRQLRIAGILLIAIGITIIIDGIGSIRLPSNTHDFWSDLERGIRTIGGILIVIIGGWLCR
jgi:uncharacterized protein YjeT (DUF2065 family)